MTLLITGGAGYIGGQTALVAMDVGREVVVIDDLSTGRSAPPGVIFVQADAGDTETVARVMRRHRVTEVIHFAASVVAPRSVNEPLLYYRNNVGTLIGLLRACAAADVSRFAFSSTAAVYGERSGPLHESSLVAPVSPYGRSKAMAETILADVTAATRTRATILRYFNVAGADPQGRTGQATTGSATHLFKIACEVAASRRDQLIVHGDDWPTRDGTGVRDYVHVHDLARAHLLALERMDGQLDGETDTFNLGSGCGYSVREVIIAVSRAAGHELPVYIGPRRPGDVAELIADAGRAREALGWDRRYGLEDIAAHALAWERQTSGQGGGFEVRSTRPILRKMWF